MNDVYEKNALTKRMVELTIALENLRLIATDIRVNRKLSDNQRSMMDAITTFGWADEIHQSYKDGKKIITSVSGGDGLCFRLDRLLDQDHGNK